MRIGIRAQLVLWLAALLALAFAPLIFAIANLAQATFTKSWESQATALGRAIGAHVNEARTHRSTEDLAPLLQAQIGDRVGAVLLYGQDGAIVAQVGSTEGAKVPARVALGRDQVIEVVTDRGPALLVIVPGQHGSAGALLRTDPAAVRVAPLVQLIGLYVGILGLGLMFVTYVMMTRVVVSPVEQLSRQARKVAEGARVLRVPKRGGRELLDLGASLATMTQALRAEEEQLRANVEELEQMHTDLQQAQDTVIRSERLASVGRLAAGLAHEIGNPIAAILSFQELVLDGPLDEEQRDFMQRMKRETERVNGILRDLLDFARPRTADASDVGDVSASVKEAIEQVAGLVRPQKSFAKIALSVEVASKLPAVAMHPERIEQVLLNLILNAADVVDPEDGAITVRATRHDGGAAVSIEDNGGGVAPSVRGRLFEPFVTTKDIGKGTGLGLAVCRGLVETAGGTIRVEDGEEGARFVVELPAATDSEV